MAKNPKPSKKVRPQRKVTQTPPSKSQLLPLFGTARWAPCPGGTSGPLRVRYRRVVRFYAPTDLIVNYTPAQPQGETVRFWIDRDAFDYFRVEQIVPQPESAQLLPDRILYEFQAPETGQPLRVAFDIRPDRVGSLPVRFGEDAGGSIIEFRQFVLP